ncbi:MAG: TolC family protein [Burkholderiales bacterium]
MRAATASIVLMAACWVPVVGARAAADFPDLPPESQVLAALTQHPAVLAAEADVQFEEANRRRLKAGTYEFHVRAEVQNRHVLLDPGSTNYAEYGVAVERPVRLPGKATLDEEIGSEGVEVARLTRGAAMHDTSRRLLQLWFAWLREHAAVQQWLEQVAVLQQQVAITSKRLRAGDAPRLELNLAAAAASQAEASALQARTRESIARTELEQTFPGLRAPQTVVFVEPQPVTQPFDYWRDRIVEYNHEIARAREEVKRRELLVSRARADQTPDPTLGVRYMNEFGGAEKIAGMFVSMPIPGEARAASSQAAVAQVSLATQQESAALRMVGAEMSATYHGAVGAFDAAGKAREAADAMTRNADLTGRAYQLGESSLNDVLVARRLALEAGLALRNARLQAQEARYRLLLDAHLLWPIDLDEDADKGQEGPHKDDGRAYSERHPS